MIVMFSMPQRLACLRNASRWKTASEFLGCNLKDKDGDLASSCPFLQFDTIRGSRLSEANIAVELGACHQYV